MEGVGLGSTASWWRGDGGGEIEGVEKNVGHVRTTGRRLVTPVSTRCVPIIRRWIPWRRKCKKGRKLGKKGIRSVRRGIRKLRAKAPRGREKGPKNLKTIWKSVHRSSFTAKWSLDPVVKPFGTTVKKEVRNKVETSEKIWGYVAGEGESENSGQEPPRPLKRAPKNFEFF